MRKPRADAPANLTSPLLVRLDAQSKELLVQAASLRHVSVSDFVRLVTIEQARKEVEAAAQQTIRMTAEEQLAFWTALNQPTKSPTKQKKLGRIMRGEA